jgi:uncharacterized protein (TIGR02453 family)
MGKQLNQTLTFLAGLKENNDRTWFQAHKEEYEAGKAAFEDFLDEIIDALRVEDNLKFLRGKDCISRIYRDVRFSKDKSPYKLNMGAMIAPGGWKGNQQLGYYVSVEPGGESMVAGGLYAPSTEQLMRFREMVVRDPSKFKMLTSEAAFVQAFGEITGDKLKTAPRGYEKDHPEIELLRLKQIFAWRKYSDEEVKSVQFAEDIIEKCNTLRPLLRYMQEKIV